MSYVFKKGTTDVTRHVLIVDATTGAEETGATITNFDLQYTRVKHGTGAHLAASVKVDATALSGMTDAHADNKMIEVDASFSPGQYRVDWPDAAFADATGISTVLLTVTSSDSFHSATEEIQLVDYDPDDGANLGLSSVPTALSHIGPRGFGIFLDTGASNTNTVLGTDGIESNPVSTIGAAQTLITSLGIKRLYIMNNSSVSLDVNSDEYEFLGHGASHGNSLSLNNKTVDFASFRDLAITGIQGGTSSAEIITLFNCELSALTNLHCHAHNCALTGDLTITAHTDQVFSHCWSAMAASDIPALTFSAGTSDTDFRMYAGGLELVSMSGTAKLGFDCPAGELIFAASCSGGSVKSRGNHDFTDNASLAVTHTQTARVTNTTVNTECDTALTDLNLDHLMKTAVASNSDMTTEVTDGTVLSNIMSKTSDTSSYVVATDSLEAIGDGAAGASASTIADAVWDEIQSGHVAAGSTGLALNALSALFTNSSPMRLIDHLRAIMSKGATAPSSGTGTYSPATDSLEFAGECHAGIKGSGFNTGTDSLEAIRNAIDTLLAPAVVSSSALSGSGFLSDCVSSVRKATDEPSVVPKYTDSDIVSLIQSAFDVILTDININTDHPWLIRHNITLVSGTQDYILPPGVGELLRVAKVNSTTNLVEYETVPGSIHSAGQSGWKIEGNKLRLLRDWQSTDTLEILYRPTGDGLIHKGTSEAETSTSLTLMATPTDGTLDKRPNGLVGMMIRILSSTQNVVEERLITAYNVTTRVATIDVAWDTTPTGTVVYEVVPLYSRIIKDVVCLRAAIDLLAQEGSAKRMQTLSQSYMVKIAAMRRSISAKEARFPHHFEGEGWDNSNLGGIW